FFWNHSRSGELWVMQADGQRKRQLALHQPALQVSGPAFWSPDGKRIAFTAGCTGQEENQTTPERIRVNLWLMNSDGSHLRKGAEGVWMGPQWSPDGTKIYWPHRGFAVATGSILTDSSGQPISFFKGLGFARWLPD